MPAGTSIGLPSMVSFGIVLLRRLARTGAVLGDAPLELGAEMPDQPLDRPGRGIAQGADRVALDLVLTS